MTNRIFNLSVATMAYFATNLILPAPSRAADVLCTGPIGAVTVDNLIVPDNVTCTLNKTRINGSVELGLNSILIARGVTIIGNIQGDGAKTITITQAGPSTSPISSQVGGNIELQNSGAVTINAGTSIAGDIISQKGGAVTIVAGTRVGGDIILEEHTGLLIINSNSVRGSVQVSKNLGGARIRSNTIAGNLQCQDNLPAPTGALNTVSGNKEDQCAMF
jgi:hypothetical protein